MGARKLKKIGELVIDIKTNIVQNDTIPVSERHFYGTRIPSDIKCFENGKYQNVELFSPVIYDLDDRMPRFNDEWIVWDNPNVKLSRRNIVTINYPPKYLQWWYRQRQRCLEGYEVGGVKITGDHYFYLNFWRIKAKGRGIGDIPPMFLDLDKQFFDYVDQARAEDKNLMCLKRRQIGFSEKVAAMCAKEFTFFPSSQSLIIAGEEKYSINTFNKAKRGLDAMSSDSQTNAAREFFKRRIKETEELIIAGFKTNSVSNGYLSELWQITTKDNAQAASGKSPTLVIMEEVGINPLLSSVYSMILPSVQERGMQNGRIVIFIGTGGEMKKGVAQFMEMFYKPEANNLFAVDNIWDEGAQDSKCCPFFPAWMYHIMDHDGNSYKEASIIDIKETKELYRKTDKEKYYEYLTQMPLTPEEAFSVSGASPFDVEKLTQQRTYLLNNDWKDKVQLGRFEPIIENKQVVGVQWKPAPAGKEYVLDSDGDFKYPVRLFEHPERPHDDDGFTFLVGDQFYQSLYGGGTDSYDKDQAETSSSKGSMTITKGYLNANTTSNLPVCRITWRPSKKEKFYEQTALAHLYYGHAQNLIEWSNILILEWYKANGYEALLKLRPTITYANVKESKVHNKYGVDPNTKYVWVEHTASWIKDYYDNIYDLELVTKLMAFKNKKEYNCDDTIGFMLSIENLYDDRSKGYVVDQNVDNEDESNIIFGGFVKVGGRLKRV